MKSGRIVLMVAALLSGPLALAQEFTLRSEAVAPGSRLTAAQVYDGFGCTGENVSPDLRWTPGPEGTRSYAVTVFDPDARAGSGWWHWIVFNLPAEVTALKAGAGSVGGGSLPAGAAHGRSDFGTFGFGGACPPAGDEPHRYVFTVYALGTETLEVPGDATAALIGSMLDANALARAEFTATYGR